MASIAAGNPPEKPGLTLKSRRGRETDLNTIQGQVVKQEYPIFLQNQTPRQSFISLQSK